MISWDDVVKVVTTTLVLRNTETGAIFLQSTNTCSLKQLYTHRGRNHRLTYRVLTFRLSISSFALLSTIVPRYNTTSNITRLRRLNVCVKMVFDKFVRKGLVYNINFVATFTTSSQGTLLPRYITLCKYLCLFVYTIAIAPFGDTLGS